MVSYSKMNKKQRAAIDKQKRNTWDFSPITRVKQSKKVYNRKRDYDGRRAYV